MDYLIDTSNKIILGNSVLIWAEAFALIIAVIGVLYLFKVIALHRLQATATRHNLAWPGHTLNALDEIKFVLLFVIAVGTGASILKLPPHLEKGIENAAIVAIFIQVGLWLNALYMSWYNDYREVHLTQNASMVTTLDATRVLVRMVIWLCILLVAVNSLGFNVSALVTGLGVGGIAIALAVQKILGDILASLAIVTDKPFVMGDFVILDDYMGNVEHIGLKTTHLRSLGGEQIIFSNSDLLSHRIRNYGRMYERRVAVTIGVTYQTPIEKLKLIPQIIKDAVTAQPDTRIDRSNLQKFGDSSIDFEYVYYVLSPDYNVYMDIQEAINLTILQRFTDDGIDFAYPTQTVFLQKEAVPTQQ